MAFWDVVKNIANSAKCASGWHAGDYSHRSRKPKCHMEKTCPDCGKHVTKEVHKYGDWKYPTSTCDAKRVCIHCGHDEFKVIHNYERVRKDSNCRIIEQCNRCHDEKIGRAEHEWITLFGREMKTTDKKRKCKNCGELG